MAANPPRLVGGPNLNKAPFRTGNPGETLADRERVTFGLPADIIGPAAAGALVALIAGIFAALAFLLFT